MKDIKVVIGANFGDEGKGLMTDYLSSISKNGIVVRFNGGAQAGHTVTTPEGRRHVFGHLGSGTFAGLPTYLSSYFVVNPMLFVKETRALERWNLMPKVYAHKDCMVTTPYDMMINQIAEIVRRSSKHGSCGVGFNETIVRSLYNDAAKLSVKDLMNEALLREKLIYIRDSYAAARLKELGVTRIPEPYNELLGSDGILENYIYDIKNMMGMLMVADIDILSSYESIIFEGAQGLLLDQNHEYFPHVTRSNTGMKNVVSLLEEASMTGEAVEIIYVTRAYATRHGAGPFPGELPEKPYTNIQDLTNVPNAYQGTLRFGLLDLDLLARTIKYDLKNAEGFKFKVSLAITCLDQLDDKADYIFDSRKTKSDLNEFIQNTFLSAGIRNGYLSFGETRRTVRMMRL